MSATKEEIKDHLWPSTHVTEVNLPPLVLDLRHALGDDPHRPRYPRTFLRDERIAGPTPLVGGDEVRLGDVTLTFCADPDSSIG